MSRAPRQGFEPRLLGPEPSVLPIAPPGNVVSPPKGCPARGACRTRTGHLLLAKQAFFLMNQGPLSATGTVARNRIPMGITL